MECISNEKASFLFIINVALGATSSETAGSEQRRVAGVVAVGFPVVFGVRSRRQGLVAFFTSQAGRVPVLSQRSLPFGCKNVTIRT